MLESSNSQWSSVFFPINVGNAENGTVHAADEITAGHRRDLESMPAGFQDSVGLDENTWNRATQNVLEKTALAVAANPVSDAANLPPSSAGQSPEQSIGVREMTGERDRQANSHPRCHPDIFVPTICVR